MTSYQLLKEVLRELHQLDLTQKLHILWFVLKLRLRRKIYNLTGRFLKLRLVTVAVSFIRPKITKTFQFVLPSSLDWEIELLNLALLATIIALAIKVFFGK
jgi:hypothetical protein